MFAPIASLVALLVPLPMIKSPVVVIGDRLLNPADAVAAFVPPLAIGKVPDTPVVKGNPVAFVRVPLEGVPNAPPLTTTDPVDPTVMARAVATLVPRPLTPVEMGNPVALVSVPELGVPRAPPLTTKAPADPVFTAKAVATPVPKPVIAPIAGVIVTVPAKVNWP